MTSPPFSLFTYYRPANTPYLLLPLTYFFLLPASSSYLPSSLTSYPPLRLPSFLTLPLHLSPFLTLPLPLLFFYPSFPDSFFASFLFLLPRLFLLLLSFCSFPDPIPCPFPSPPMFNEVSVPRRLTFEKESDEVNPERAEIQEAYLWGGRKSGGLILKDVVYHGGFGRGSQMLREVYVLVGTCSGGGLGEWLLRRAWSCKQALLQAREESWRILKADAVSSAGRSWRNITVRLLMIC